MIQAVPEKNPSDNKEPNGSDTVDLLLDIGNGQKLILPKREDNLLGGMAVPRRFSKEEIHPYDEVAWVRRDVVIMDYGTGKPNFERKGVEVPAGWADNAVRITASKYLFGNEPGTPEYEDSLKQVFDRISNTYTVWGWKHGYFVSPEDALRYNHELKAMQVRQLWAPNSPVWFNVGLWEQWRWGRPDLRKKFARRGNKAFKAYLSADGDLDVKRYQNTYEHPQAAACFLLGIEDSMESILDHYKAEGGIFASGSGAGMNISTLRSSYEPIAGKGRSSGPVAFDRGLDASAGAIKSGGKTRRAARMLILSSDHPDIFKFVNAKNNQEEIGKIILREHNVCCELVKIAKKKQEKGSFEEQIAADFILSLPQVNDRVYSSQMDDLLYGETLAFQNSNHSVSFKGDFWRAYATNGEYSTRWVSDPSHIQDTFKAARLLDEIVRCIWNNAEPGVHNNDFINLWNPAKSDGEIVTSNPCSEYLHLNNTSCNLSSFNLYGFYDASKKSFDVDGFRHAVRLAMLAADMNVEEGGFPIPEIALGTYKYRTTGLGYANLGGLLMAMGIPYDSDKGRYIASVVTSFLTSTAFSVSYEMGKELGAYLRFEETKNDLSEVLHLHRAAQKLMERVPQLKDHDLRLEVDAIYVGEKRNLPSAQGITGRDALEGYLKSFTSTGAEALGSLPEWVGAMCASASSQWDAVCSGAEESRKVRNNFVTCIAPTGTISAAMGVYDKGTTSAEPDYTLVKYKQLSGGGSLKMFNSLALEALATLGYSSWEVREAALEVAGLDGLFVACDQSMDKVVKHLRAVPQHEPDRTRVALQHLVETGELKLDANAVAAFCDKGRKGKLTGEALAVCNGTSTTEFISWIKPEDQAVFDCSATNGAGTRSIAPEGHIRMLGALQPFISGATSKTVNLPYTATELDIRRCIVGCHGIGVKCTAFFRAESKAESVFSLDTPEGRKYSPPEVWKKVVASVSGRTQAIVAEASKPRRTRLPGRRTGQIVKFRIDNLDGYLQIGIYPDGRCGEVFGTVGQGGSFANGMFSAFCKGFSTSLQYGVPLKELTESFRYMSFDPSGFCKVGDATPDGGAGEIHAAKSVIDLMMQILDWLFPDGYLKDLGGCDVTLAQHPQGESDANSVSVAAAPFCVTSVQNVEKPENDGWGKTDVAAQTAMSCPRCHSLAYVRDGHCRTCRNCGYKDGGCGE